MAEQKQPAAVLSATDLTPRVRQLVLKPKTAKIAFQPGQWVSLHLPVGPKPPLNRAYSMADPSSPYGELTLVFDLVPDGLGSPYLYQLKSGDEITLSGPYGRFILPETLDRELILIGRYTGLVPIRCLLKQMFYKKIHTPVLLIAVAPSEEEVLFHQEWLTMAVQQPSFRYLPIVAEQSEFQAVEKTLAMLAPLLTGQPKVIPMLCGTKAFVRPLRAYFTEQGYDRKEVKVETYD
ncbi:MAG: FAD-binding oxidoreductase [Nitrospira sp.]|nr:FAD-binding oxidoreductase [Nitrospira sp.]MDH4303611.1 FAD-binding oxidoreductase [Nitrospira sp.]MDH5192888.1 FAD-binding oxidoreductase [Nitrospira sp.]